MTTKSYVNILRAVGSEYVVGLLRPLAIILAFAMALLIGVAVWLTTVNVWFWIFDGFVFILLLVLLGIVLATLFLLRILRPEMSLEQRAAVRTFTEKLQQTTEDIRTPWPWIAAKVAYSVVFPSENAYLSRLIKSSKTLYPDFRTLQNLFDTTYQN